MLLRRYAEAEKLSEKAIALIQTRVAPFWSFKAEAILAQGDLSRARAALDAAPPDIFNKHAMLARIALYERDFARAGVELEAARKAEMAPEWQYLDLIAGTIARVQGDATGAFEAFDQARGSLEAGLEKHSNEPAVVANLAWAYAGLGRKEDALRTSQQAGPTYPKLARCDRRPFLREHAGASSSLGWEQGCSDRATVGLVEASGRAELRRIKVRPGLG